jgi:DNA gyrase subunit A
MVTNVQQNIPRVRIEDEMRTSYLDYAMSVIIGRALPDVRDGLKPVHRRVLYAMFREGLLHNRRYSKCAGVVGEVLKKYHPHGDSAVYDTLVRMAQEWNLRYPLVDGQGNFGSIDGDSAAAYRYTESRMTRLAERMLQDIDKETVDFTENFDGSTMEPTVLPTLFPSLLVNGSDGIAVGMATKIPPHNLGEVLTACVHLIDNPDTTVHELVCGRSETEEQEALEPLIPGPDFPTGGIIHSRKQVLQAYKTGRGIVQIRARARIEEDEKTNRSRIIIDEVPYQVNKARLVEKIALLVKEKKIEGISDLRDESNREGIRVVVDLKKDAFPEIVLNQLYKHSPLQSSFGIILLAIVRGQPVELNLKQLLTHFIDHRREVTTRRCRYELRKAEARAHILEGLKKALDHIDEIITLIRSSPNTAAARQGLIDTFEFSARQAQAILELRLQKLTALERDQILEELQALLQEIERLRNILSNEPLLLQLIKDEMQEIIDSFSDPRRSAIAESADQISLEDMIADDDMVVTLTHTGYIKRCPLTEYRAQRRGGRGVQGMNTRDSDFVVELFVASSLQVMLIFTNKGRVFQLKVYELPQASRTALGRPLVNLLQFEEGEKPTAIMPISEFTEGRYVLFATRKGIIKRTDLMQYSRPRSGGLIAIRLDDDDELIGVDHTEGESRIFIGTKGGLAIHFEEDTIRSTGRATRGVRGIRLNKGDEVVSLVVTTPDKDILTVSERGYGKRSQVEEYRLTNRGGKGVITMKSSERNGDVAGLLEVSDSDQLMFSTDAGRIIRIRATELRSQGRNTQGVRLFKIDEGERITSVALLAETDDEDEESVEGAEGGEGSTSPENASETASSDTPEGTTADASTGDASDAEADVQASSDEGPAASTEAEEKGEA